MLETTWRSSTFLIKREYAEKIKERKLEKNMSNYKVKQLNQGVEILLNQKLITISNFVPFYKD